jgi:hypothetical protein
MERSSISYITQVLFFFKIHIIEYEVKNYLLRADYESRNNQPLADWLNNLGVGAVSQLEGGRKITFWEFSVAASKIVRSLERGALIDSQEATQQSDIQDNDVSLEVTSVFL